MSEGRAVPRFTGLGPGGDDAAAALGSGPLVGRAEERQGPSRGAAAPGPAGAGLGLAGQGSGS